MGPLKKILYCVCLLALLLPACTVKKRLHRKGYYVEWHTRQKIKSSAEKDLAGMEQETKGSLMILKEETVVISEPETELQLQADLSGKPPVPEQKTKPKIPLIKNNPTAKTFKDVYSYQKKRIKMPFEGERIEKETNKLGIAGVIFGILGILCFGFGFLFSISAIIMGSVARKDIRKNPDKYKNAKSANASIILGIVGLALSMLFLLLFVAFLMAFSWGD